MLFQWDCRNRNPVLLIDAKSTHTRKQVLLLKTLSKQLNAIPMSLSKQKYRTHTRKQVILLKNTVETAQCYFNGFVETGILYS